MVDEQAGKGHARRPCLTSKAEENLRYALLAKQISFAQFKRKMKKVKHERRLG